MQLRIVQGRKDELIRKHYEKLGKWKEMLADAQVAPQHPSTARASRSHIQLYIFRVFISYPICSVLAPAPPRAQLWVPGARPLTAASCPATPTLAWRPLRCASQCSV